MKAVQTGDFWFLIIDDELWFSLTCPSRQWLETKSLEAVCGSGPSMGLMSSDFLSLLVVAAAQSSSLLPPEQLKRLTSFWQQHRLTAPALFGQC